MKIRLSHVTNSSSSSFYVLLRYVTEEQLERILNPKDFIKTKEFEILFYEWQGDEGDWISVGSFREDVEDGETDRWNICVEDDVLLVGDTNMDNFDYPAYLEILGVSRDKIRVRR